MQMYLLLNFYLFFVIILSFVSLIPRAPAKEPKMGRGKSPPPHTFPRGQVSVGGRRLDLGGLKRDTHEESVWRGKVTQQRGMLLEVGGLWGVVSQSSLNLTVYHVTWASC